MGSTILTILVIIGVCIFSLAKADNNSNNSKPKSKKDSLFEKEADAHGLTPEEKKIAKEQGYDVWDFEEDDDEDSYYNDDN